MNISELKEKVINGASVTDLTEDELAECIHTCQKVWIAWKKSNAAASAKSKIAKVALKDPEILALMAKKGIVI